MSHVVCSEGLKQVQGFHAMAKEGATENMTSNAHPKGNQNSESLVSLKLNPVSYLSDALACQVCWTNAHILELSVGPAARGQHIHPIGYIYFLQETDLPQRRKVCDL